MSAHPPAPHPHESDWLEDAAITLLCVSAAAIVAILLALVFII
jgi:hypothetical protein